MPQRARILEFGLASLIFAVISLFSAWQQEATWYPMLAGDAIEYYRMAMQFDSGLPYVQATGPFVYRIATPWLASFGTWSDIERLLPFYLINIASAFATSWLLLLWLRRFVTSPAVRLLLVAMYMVEWHSPVRFVYFYPVYVDPPFTVCVMIGLLLIDSTSARTARLMTPILALVVFFGTLVRESMVVVAAAFVVPAGFHQGVVPRLRWREFAWRTVPLAAALVALAYSRAIGFLTAPYSPLAEPLSMLERKPVFTWVLGWFFTFGPAVIALIAVDGAAAVRFLRARPHLAFWLVACLMMSFFGGTDTERIAAWAMPVVYALAGRAIESHRTVFRHLPLVAVLVVAQAVSARVFWPIPSMAYNIEPFSWTTWSFEEWYEAFNRLAVIHTHYTYLWSYFGSRKWHAALLAYDVCFVIGIALWMRAIERRGATGLASKF